MLIMAYLRQNHIERKHTLDKSVKLRFKTRRNEEGKETETEGKHAVIDLAYARYGFLKHGNHVGPSRLASLIYRPPIMPVPRNSRF